MPFDIKKVSSYTWEKTENGDLYMPLADKNGFCHISQDGKVNVKKIFEELPFISPGLFQDSLCCNGNIVLIPYNAEKIVIYNMEKNELTYIPILWPSEQWKYADVRGKLCGGFAVGNDVYMLGYYLPVILKLDLHRKEISFLQLDMDNLGAANSEKKPFFRYGCVCDNNTAYIPLINAPYILKIDLKNDKVTYIHMKGMDGGYGGITCRNKKLYLTGWISNLEILAEYDLLSGQVNKYKTPNSATFAAFYSVVDIQGDLFLLPALSNKAYCFDTKEKIIVEIEKISELLINNNGDQVSCIGWKVIDDVLFFQTMMDNNWNSFDPRSGIVKTWEYHFPSYDEYLLKCLKELFVSKSIYGIITEEHNYHLQNFLEGINIE